MTYLILKVVVTVVLVVAVSEVARRSTLWAGLLASLPVVSLLAMFWLYAETRSTEKVASLATSILWMILPSLPIFVVLPILLRKGWSFHAGLGLSMAMTVALYLATLATLKKLGIAV